MLTRTVAEPQTLFMRAITTILVVLIIAGCSTSRTRPDGSTDTGAPVDSCRDAGDTAVDSDLPPIIPAETLDLLLMVDNSGSMTEEQASMGEQLPRLIRELGTRYRSIQVGVITSDMGTGGFRVPTCRVISWELVKPPPPRPWTNTRVRGPGVDSALGQVCGAARLKSTVSGSQQASTLFKREVGTK